MPNLYPGTGADGAIVFDGVSSIAHCTLASGVYTLTGDINATSVLQNPGVVVKTANWKIFCSGAVLLRGDTDNNGGDGGNGPAGSMPPGGGAGGQNTTGISAGSLLSSAPGSASSGAGGTEPGYGAGGNSSAGSGTSTTPGGDGGDGGAGGTTAGPEVGGSGAQGGGGGGGGGARSLLDVGPRGGDGGGAGGYGGTVWISGSTITLAAGSSVTANGGKGGNGGAGGSDAGSSSNDGGGGGGGAGSGGAGGSVQFFYGALFVAKTATVSAKGGAGGVGGAGGAPASSGVAGQDGGDGADGPDGTVSASGITIIGHGCNENNYDNGGPLMPAFPPGQGTLVEDADLESVRNWCAANGISISVCQDSQRTAKDFLDELLTVSNHFAVYSGDRFKIIGYDEVSAAGGGRVYISPTSSGPIADLTDQDFIVNGKEPPISISQKSRPSCDNVVAIEHVGRNIEYQRIVTSENDAMAIALDGPRKGGTLDAADLGVNAPSGSKSLLSLYDAIKAQVIGSILAKRGAAGVNEHSFALGAEWADIEAGDLVTVSDNWLGLVLCAVRITEAAEQSDRTVKCKADLFVYGLNHPDVRAVSTPTGTQVLANVDPGLVNTPIIFEPPAAMLPLNSPPQVWIIVSGSDPNYGSCVPFVSVDGGAHYDPFGGSIAPGITGVLTADYPAGADPDTTDSLQVDLTESNGEVISRSQQIADGFADPCYVAGASGFEIVCPTAVTPTAPYKYSLGTYIRRAVQGTSAMDHPIGSRFGVTDAALKINLPPAWMGQTVLLKFAAQNKISSQQNDLSECVAYPFTPQGNSDVVSSTNPETVITQPTATQVATAALDATYEDGRVVHYNSRTFTIPDPGSSPQTYYVTIYDPTRAGDGGGTLTSYCDTTPTRANTPGYVFAGKIIATHAAGGTGSIAGPGGINQVLVTVG